MKKIKETTLGVMFCLVVMFCLILGFAGGFVCGRDLLRMRDCQALSLAGGALQGLHRAIDDKRTQTGAYPESLDRINGADFASGDYSRTLVERATYVPTGTGYVLVVGQPHHACVDQTGRIQFK